MSRTTRRDIIVELLHATPAEQRLLVARMRGTELGVRIFPGPAPTPAIVYGRIRYAQTGVRQWVIAPGMAWRTVAVGTPVCR